MSSRHLIYKPTGYLVSLAVGKLGLCTWFLGCQQLWLLWLTTLRHKACFAGLGHPPGCLSLVVVTSRHLPDAGGLPIFVALASSSLLGSTEQQGRVHNVPGPRRPGQNHGEHKAVLSQKRRLCSQGCSLPRAHGLSRAFPCCCLSWADGGLCVDKPEKCAAKGESQAPRCMTASCAQPEEHA